MATRICTTCQAPAYGTPFCVSCQAPILGNLSSATENSKTHLSPEPIVNTAGVIRAGFFRRLAAFAIDWLVLSILADIVSFAYRFGSGADPGIVHLNIALGFSSVLFILYFTLFTGEGGQTLGKMLLGIRVQDLDGSTIGFGRAFLRSMGYFVSVFFMTFLGFLWALWDKKNQTWHDKIAGTVVVRI